MNSSCVYLLSGRFQRCNSDLEFNQVPCDNFSYLKSYQVPRIFKPNMFNTSSRPELLTQNPTQGASEIIRGGELQIMGEGHDFCALKKGEIQFFQLSRRAGS